MNTWFSILTYKITDMPNVISPPGAPMDMHCIYIYIYTNQNLACFVVYTVWHLATARPHYGSFRGSPFRDTSVFFLGNLWTSDEFRGMPEHSDRQTVQRQTRKLTGKEGNFILH